jgi:hypothetical protein
MSGTTPGDDAGQDPQRDPFSQPGGQAPQRPPAWGQGQPPAWGQNQQPSWESGNTAGPDVPQPPRQIVLAARLMYVGAAITLVSLIFALMSRDVIRDAVIETQPNLSADEIDAAVNFGYGIATVLPTIAIVLWLWMAWANRRGRSWARIVATILGGLNILFALLNLATGGFGVNTLINLISPALAAVILYMLYRPESGEYYRAMSAKLY